MVEKIVESRKIREGAAFTAESLVISLIIAHEKCWAPADKLRASH